MVKVTGIDSGDPVSPVAVTCKLPWYVPAPILPGFTDTDTCDGMLPFAVDNVIQF